MEDDFECKYRSLKCKHRRQRQWPALISPSSYLEDDLADDFIGTLGSNRNDPRYIPYHIWRNIWRAILTTNYITSHGWTYELTITNVHFAWDKCVFSMPFVFLLVQLTRTPTNELSGIALDAGSAVNTDCLIL